MNYAFIRKNINSFAILIFLVSFLCLNYFQPAFIYNKDGSLREFGLGQKRKTIWLLSIVLGILSYLLVLYYITIPKF